MRAPSPCVRTTDPETELVWASRRGSWECECPALSGEHGLLPKLSRLYRATGTAQRAGLFYLYARPSNANRRNGLRRRKIETYVSFRSTAANLSLGWMHSKMRFWVSIFNSSLWKDRFKKCRSKIGQFLKGCKEINILTRHAFNFKGSLRPFSSADVTFASVFCLLIWEDLLKNKIDHELTNSMSLPLSREDKWACW